MQHTASNAESVLAHILDRADALQRYQCIIGHAFTPSALLAGLDEEVEEALEVALRTLEERAEESKTHADRIRKLLQRGA